MSKKENALFTVHTFMGTRRNSKKKNDIAMDGLAILLLIKSPYKK